MQQFKTLSSLNDDQKERYTKAIDLAFPKIILKSAVIKEYWSRLETYFPDTQIFLHDEKDNLIGFMNMIPFHWDNHLRDLPDEGWDWMLQKGIDDYENNIKANVIGGLQIIIPTEHQSKGHSKTIIAEGKKTMLDLGLKQLLIPIRPTLKHKHPAMAMKEYLLMKTDNGKVYDPWIRTHLNGGAEIIKVCSNSMNVKGEVSFWEELLGEKIDRSGLFYIDGALNLVDVNVEENTGEYREENIWICYG